MTPVDFLLDASGVHEDWRELLSDALATVDEAYLAELVDDPRWLPGVDALLAAFRRDARGLRYLVFGESPYPRRESANGIAFFDAAVGELWSPTGLSKAVNRATSLRNIIKTALLAEGYLTGDTHPDRRARRARDTPLRHIGHIGDTRSQSDNIPSAADTHLDLSQEAIAAIDKRGLVKTLPQLFANLEAAGFLLMNATPVLHPLRKPAIDARFWLGFVDRLLAGISHYQPTPTLLLWGKIATLIDKLPATAAFPTIRCEHPYNLSFINNAEMQNLFARLEIMQSTASCSS